MTEIDQTLAAVERNLLAPEFKARLFVVLSRTGHYSPPKSHIMYYRTMAAVDMMRRGMTRAEVSQALRSTFGIGKTQSYEIIHRALNSRGGRYRVR